MPQEHFYDGTQESPARYVFVYGTLRRGGSNDITRLEPRPRWIGKACVPGVLYTLGAYPGLRLEGHAEGDCPVCGEVYAIEPALERVLDLIEGLRPGEVPDEADEYAKRDVWVQVGNQSLRCLLYEIHPRFAQWSVRLHHGDWMQVC